MGALERKQELFDNIVRLRRAARASADNAGLSAVRVSLERQLGETVSRRLAARVLGVSHTALNRWIETGDVPVVYSTRGRVEVPVPALLELRESVESNRENGSRRYVLAPAMLGKRAAAKRLELPEFDEDVKRDDHDRARVRALAYHRAIAQRLGKPMVDEARHVLFRWRHEGRIDERYAKRWERALDLPIPELRDALVDERQESDDLRQNSPFAGVLSEPERKRIVREVV